MPPTKPDLRYISHAAHRVAVLSGNVHASGTPLIFLHGIAGSVDFWPALLPPSVRQQRRWYSVGLPNHGAIGLRNDTLSCEHVAADLVSPEPFADILATVIRKVAPAQRVTLVGYSTGGFAALNLAARAPELVANVVSISGFSIGKWHGNLGRLQALASRGSTGRRACATLWSWMTSHPTVFRRLLLANAGRVDVGSAQTEAILDLFSDAARQQDSAALAKLFAGIRRFDINPLLQNIRMPVLIAGGDRDPVIPYRHTCDMASAIKGAELVTFRDVGHLFFAECLDRFREMLESWLARHEEMKILRRVA